MFETFVPPAIEDGDQYSPKDHIGTPVIVKVRERKEGIVTSNSPQGGPGVIVDLVDLKDGNVYRNVLWMGGAFVDALTQYIGKGPVVLEIESRKSATSGRNYTAPKAADDAQIKLAESYYTSKGDPFAQTFATVDTPATPAATDTPPWG